MTGKTIFVAALAGFALLSGVPSGGVAAARAACMAGDQIDSSTPAQATQKMTAAGYSDIHDLRKGCDNYWHAQAMRNGASDRIVLSPKGRVMLDGASRIALVAGAVQSADAH